MSTAALWTTIVALGLYHGLNPAMGWPLAVANGMVQHRAAALPATLLPLAGGHFAAMAVVLLPWIWLAWYAQWSLAIRVGAAALVLGFGLYKLLRPRHPRALAAIPPSRLAWWSFLMATAHGAGLMLLPFMIGLCTAAPPAGDAAARWVERGHAALSDLLAQSGTATALAVAGAHTLAMLVAGLAMAWVVYRYLGLRVLRSLWFNLDRVWGASLVLAGAAGVAMAL
ncbi:MAG: hypothetical protein KIT60_06540 [Burkholderiaceae bacterium]|jgi:hypothetical protein|nr:hypothetical protein [Burkholderiaceae bacterium]